MSRRPQAGCDSYASASRAYWRKTGSTCATCASGDSPRRPESASSALPDKRVKGQSPNASFGFTATSSGRGLRGRRERGKGRGGHDVLPVRRAWAGRKDDDADDAKTTGSFVGNREPGMAAARDATIPASCSPLFFRPLARADRKSTRLN